VILIKLTLFYFSVYHFIYIYIYIYIYIIFFLNCWVINYHHRNFNFSGHFCRWKDIYYSSIIYSHMRCNLKMRLKNIKIHVAVKESERSCGVEESVSRHGSRTISDHLDSCVSLLLIFRCPTKPCFWFPFSKIIYKIPI